MKINQPSAAADIPKSWQGKKLADTSGKDPVDKVAFGSLVSIFEGGYLRTTLSPTIMEVENYPQ